MRVELASQYESAQDTWFFCKGRRRNAHAPTLSEFCGELRVCLASVKLQAAEGQCTLYSAPGCVMRDLAQNI